HSLFCTGARHRCSEALGSLRTRPACRIVGLWRTGPWCRPENRYLWIRLACPVALFDILVPQGPRSAGAAQPPITGKAHEPSIPQADGTTPGVWDTRAVAVIRFACCPTLFPSVEAF